MRGKSRHFLYKFADLNINTATAICTCQHELIKHFIVERKKKTDVDEIDRGDNVW